MSDAARGAPCGSLPGTRCSSPPAAASRREPQDGAPSAATPAAEPEKAAAAEPSPPRARSRPHLWPPPHQPRLLELRPRTRLQRRSTGRYPPARAGRSSPRPGLPSAPRPPLLSNPPAAPGPLPVTVPAARHFRGRGGRSRRARARGLGAVRYPELPRYQPASRCSRAARRLLKRPPGIRGTTAATRVGTSDCLAPRLTFPSGGRGGAPRAAVQRPRWSGRRRRCRRGVLIHVPHPRTPGTLENY